VVSLAKKVVVVGLGNTLMGDEGVGVRVVEELLKHPLPPYVTVHPAGTPGLALIHLIEGFDKAVLVDAVKMGGEPGAVYRFNFDPSLFNEPWPSSMHGVDAVTALKIAMGAGLAPKEVVVVGIEPKRVELREGLSKEVEASIPKAVNLVLEEVKVDE